MNDARIHELLAHERELQRTYDSACEKAESLVEGARLEGEEAAVRVFENAKERAHETYEDTIATAKKDVTRINKKSMKVIPSLQVDDDEIQRIAKQIAKSIVPELLE